MLPIDGVPERRHARDMSDHERSFNPVPRRILVPIDGDPPAEGMLRGGELSHLLRDGEDLYVLHHSPVPVLVVPEA